ncbi:MULTISPECIES: hypothetical protein [unclassified Nocardiopsis]|uniref:hypothetical protein n=1 Tax=unclassified Nocardiopsis TaxID=2649073 RepID=UPI00135B7545|nr:MULTISPECIES: hypothetical protein [unclassified Nocardiopsis]
MYNAIRRSAAALLLSTAAWCAAVSPASAHTSSDLGSIAFSSDGCGWTSGGHSVLDSQPVRTSGGTTVGRVYLLWNGANGHNCVVTLKGSGTHGSPHYTQAILDVQGRGTYTDADHYSHFAAVSAYARDRCVSFVGSIQHPTGGFAGGGREAYGFCGG